MFDCWSSWCDSYLLSAKRNLNVCSAINRVLHVACVASLQFNFLPKPKDRQRSPYKFPKSNLYWTNLFSFTFTCLYCSLPDSKECHRMPLVRCLYQLMMQMRSCPVGRDRDTASMIQPSIEPFLADIGTNDIRRHFFHNTVKLNLPLVEASHKSKIKPLMLLLFWKYGPV